MRYYKTLKKYKASNLSFDCRTTTALSYNWWEFVKVINGLVVFNDYRYSPTTQRHQSKISCLLDYLHIDVDLIIECPDGLQNLHSGVIYYNHQIEELTKEICNPRSNKIKNEYRRRLRASYASKLVQLEDLILGQRQPLAA